MGSRFVVLSFALLFFVAIVSAYGPDNSKQYSGYITVNGTMPDNGTHIFYWFFEARNNPQDAPFIIWLTGGPGCSSLTALFFENGPYTIEKDLSLKINPYSWNEVANVMWIDQPVGTGFSYADHNSDYITDEKGVAEDMYEFLQKFFALHPEYRKLDFYVTGESYAGHYVPAISARIVKGNQQGTQPKINLKGAAIGNGWVDPYIQYQSYAGLLHMKGLLDVVSAEIYNYTLLPACLGLIDAHAYPVALVECSLAMEFVLAAAEVESGRTINVYDVRIPCEVQPLCYDFSLADQFLNQDSVKEALGAKKSITWESCNMEIHSLMMGDWMGNFDVDIPILLDAGVDVLVYSGTEDFVCNYLGGQAWVNKLKWSGHSDFVAKRLQPWHVNGKQAGSAKTLNGFTFLEVFGAGHMVPLDQPVNSLDMISRFINGKPFTN